MSHGWYAPKQISFTGQKSVILKRCRFIHSRNTGWYSSNELGQFLYRYPSRYPAAESCGHMLKSHLVRTQTLKVLRLKAGVGQYIAIHATLTARDLFFTYIYPSGLFTCIFSKTSPIFFPVLAVANTGFCVGLHNKKKKRSPCWMQVPVLSARGI